MIIFLYPMNLSFDIHSYGQQGRLIIFYSIIKLSFFFIMFQYLVSSLSINNLQTIMTSKKQSLLIQTDKVISQKYQLNRLMAINEAINVYQAVNKSNDLTVTLKVETISHFHRENSLIQKQYSLFKLLKGYPGIPVVYKKGQWDNGYFMEISQLNKDLSFLAQYSKKSTMTQFAYVFCSIIRIIAAFHQIGYCLGNLSPNFFYITPHKKIFLMRCPNAKSLQEKYLNIQKSSGNRKLNASQLDYASLRSLKGRKHTYADDIQSAFYMLCHFYYKGLPWAERTSIKQIIHIKQNTAAHMIQKIGNNYLACFRYIQKLEQNVKPNCQKLIRNLQHEKQIDSIIRTSISVQKHQNQDEPTCLSSTNQIIQIQIENEKEIIRLNQQFSTSIVINRVSKKTISTFSSTIQISSKVLLELFQEIATQGFGDIIQDPDFDIQPPKMPEIRVIRVKFNPKF